MLNVKAYLQRHLYLLPLVVAILIPLVTVTVWLAHWDGTIRVTPVSEARTFRIRPDQEHPGLIVLRVTGKLSSGSARLELPGTMGAISLPEELNAVCKYDWYGGDVEMRYIPGPDISGNLRIKWQFR